MYVYEGTARQASRRSGFASAIWHVYQIIDVTLTRFGGIGHVSVCYYVYNISGATYMTMYDKFSIKLNFHLNLLNINVLLYKVVSIYLNVFCRCFTDLIIKST